MATMCMNCGTLYEPLEGHRDLACYELLEELAGKQALILTRTRDRLYAVASKMRAD